MYQYCDVVCYREREGEVNSLTLLYWNQQALRLTVKMVGERRSSYPHSVTCSLLNKERSLGHSSSVTWRGSGRRKSRMIGPQTLRAKIPLSAWEIWRRIFSLGQKSALERHAEIQPTSGKVTRKKSRTEFGKSQRQRQIAEVNQFRGGHSPVKREKEIWTLKLVKDKYNLNCFPSTIPKYWTVIHIQNRKRETEKILFHQ